MTVPLPPYVFSEFSPVGVDLDSVDSVEAYDRNQGTQDVKDDELLDRLSVGRGTVLVDLGTGTGSLPVRGRSPRRGGPRSRRSTNMLAYTGRRAAAEGVDVERHHAGFLSYELPEGSADVVARPAGEGFTREMFETHVRDEFSTFTWIIEGMIERAGLQVVESNFPAPWYGEFLALKPH